MTTDTTGPDLSRRTLLQGAGLAAGTAIGLGASSGVAAQEGPDFGGWFTEDSEGGAVANYDGTVADRRGEDAVTVEVGADGNGGTFAYAPPAVRVNPGTEITFEWSSDNHNVVVQDQPDGADWGGHEPLENAGFTFAATLETEGIYTYYCDPHLSLGMKGAIVVETGSPGGGDGGDGGGGVPADYGDWFTDSAEGGAVANFDGTTADMTGESAVAVEVGADGNGGTFAYEPPALRVSPGTEVTFEWTSDNHNVVVQDQPEGADWGGHEPLENSGFTFSHTFETEGVYTYYCDPHLSLGMKGAIVVGAPPGGGGDGGAGGDRPIGEPGITLPEFGLFSFGLLAMLTPFILAYVKRLRTPPADYEPPDPGTPGAGDTVEAADEAPARAIEHDDYDPYGTLSLIIAYLVILVVLWVFMYFVEFLGNGPTVIG